MKAILMLMISSLILGGCSFLQDVNSTLNYVNEATEYAAEADAFVNEVPALAEKAVTNPESLNELKTRLQTMKEDMNEFNQLEAPGVAADLHKQIVEYNNQALEGIDSLLNEIESGSLNPESLVNSEVFETFREIQSIVDQVQQITEGS